MKLCEVEGCDKKRKGAHYCSMHYSRLWRTGTLEPRLTGVARFWSLVDKTDSCWLWTGHINNRGYGKFATLYAHRMSWEFANGAIPDDLVVDHKCFNRNCINPAHLHLVSLAQNNQNHQGPQSNNKSGYRGVSWSKAMKKWQATASHGPITERAYFDRVEDAAAAALEMRNRLHTNNLIDRAAS